MTHDPRAHSLSRYINPILQSPSPGPWGRQYRRLRYYEQFYPGVSDKLIFTEALLGM